MNESGNANKQAASECVSKFEEVLHEGEYDPRQVCSVDESKVITNDEIWNLDYTSFIADKPVVTKTENSIEKKQNLKEFLDLAEALEQKLSIVEDNKDEQIKFSQIFYGLIYTYKKKFDELN